MERQTRQEAIDEIPFDQLTEESCARISSVVTRPTIYRRLPVTVIDADPDLYLFLVRYPEVVVNMWDLMGVTKVAVRRTGDFTFDANDGAGTASTVELIYGDRETHVYFAEGAYEGPLFRRLIRGRCVLVLKSSYTQTMDQRKYVTSQLDVFVQVDNVGAELLAKTLHPLVGKSADHNFIESTRFLGQVSQAAEIKHAKVQQLAERLTKIEPAIREEFAVRAAAVHRAAPRPDPLQFSGPQENETILTESISEGDLQTVSSPDARIRSSAQEHRSLRLRR